MPVGLDYGTSHCAIGVTGAQEPTLVSLEGNSSMLPSTLWAPMPEVRRNRRDAQGRPRPPGPEIALQGEHFDHLRFGTDAIEAHMQQPTKGYFIKSPKSFLGATGLPADVEERFHAIVGAMVVRMLQAARSAGYNDIEQAVIGRPINFQGLGGEAHNQRAENMLRDAAVAAGLRDVAFVYEPMAAAFDHEADLTAETRTLIVDVGGGTTDVSFVLLGGSHREAIDRTDDVLGHAGERTGGNDFDQLLALKQLMPDFGLGGQLQSGLPLANNVFVDAVTVNDVNAQNRFYGAPTGAIIDRWVREAREASSVARLERLRSDRLTWRLVRSAELAKIELSQDDNADVALDYIESSLIPTVERNRFEQQADRLLERVDTLLDQALQQGASAPDEVYLTGGMSGSPLIRSRIAARLAGVPIVDGDHFASVVRGLTIHASRIFS